MALFEKGLLPASFRGVPFAVVSEAAQIGRRIALHTYPNKDDPWAEDMGRAPRRFRLRGFILDNDQVYAGGPIQAQRLQLAAAVEAEGSSTLTHPTMGVLNVACISLSIGEDLAGGSMSEVEFEFVESGKQQLPSVFGLTDAGVLSASALGKIAIAVDVVRVLSVAFSSGGSRSRVGGTSSRWSARISSLGDDATALQRLTAQLPGNLGRFSQGGNSGFSGASASPYAADTTVDQLIAAASAARVRITMAAERLDTVAQELGAETTEADLPKAADDLITALAGACADPSDALRLVLRLTVFQPVGGDAISPVGTTISDLFRRSAVLALANAAATYQPTSYEDAFLLLQRVTTALDSEITIAADAGLDETYKALRAVRVAVVTDLKARGASLAHIRTYRTGGSMPALVLAQRFYRDPARSDQLIFQSAPPNPLFLPVEFQALAA